jgi:hypothetical protein
MLAAGPAGPQTRPSRGVRDAAARRPIADAVDHGGMSARGIRRALRVAHTIADLSGEASINIQLLECQRQTLPPSTPARTASRSWVKPYRRRTAPGRLERESSTVSGSWPRKQTIAP